MRVWMQSWHLKTERFFVASRLVLRERRRANLLQHSHDRLPGGAYRSLLPRPDCGDDLSLVGNYGTNFLDVESETPQVRGFVIEELSPLVSNWRSQEIFMIFSSSMEFPGYKASILVR